MRLAILVAILALTAAFSFADNPFLGSWAVSEDRYQVSDTHISGVMDGQPYESDYAYTDRTWTWKDRTWVYHFLDPDHLLVAGISDDGRPWYWLISRAKPNVGLPSGGTP